MNCKNKYVLFFWLLILIVIFNSLENQLNTFPAKEEKELPYLEQQLELMSLEPMQGTEELSDHEKIMGLNKINPPFGEELYSFNQESRIRTVAFSPDGKILASEGEFGTIKLWDVSSGTEIQSLLGHSIKISSLDFSPDGKILASGSWDKTIRLWNVSDGTPMTVFNQTWMISSVDFSPDGTMFVSSYKFFTNIKVWNTTNWEELLTLKAHNSGINDLHFSPDSKLLATTSSDNTTKIWNTSTWKNEHTFELSEAGVEVKFSFDGKILALYTRIPINGNETSTFLLYDWANDKVIHELEGHSYGGYIIYDSPETMIGSINLSPNGMVVATGGGDNLIKLCDVASGETIHILSGHKGPVCKVVFSPDGTLLASCGLDKTIKIWNIVRGAKKQTLVKHTGAVNSLDYSPDGLLLASSSDDSSVIIWNLTSGIALHTLIGHTDAVASVEFSSDGSLLVSSSWDKTIKLWNVSNGVLIQNLTGHTEVVRSATFSENGEMVVSGSEDVFDPVILWNVSNGEQLRTLYGHNGGVFSAVFSPDGTLVASCGEDKKVILTNITNGDTRQTLSGHADSVTSVAFSPTSMILASSSEDKTIKFWNVSNGVLIQNLTGHTDPVWSVTFSNDGKLLATGGTDGTIKLWNVSTGMEIYTYYSYQAIATSVAFSPDGKTLAAGSSSSIHLWNTITIPDFDEDGMSDSWELRFRFNGLDPSDYWDKFDDDDNDGLMNSLECFIGTYPNDTDSDNDDMPDGWEYLSGLDPTIADAMTDGDNDDMPALYEYQMGLNPWINDASEDNDNDGLTNLQEYLFGSWANQTDSDLDGMPDFWEFTHTDVNYRFNPRNSSDTKDDPDGDWINNLDEFRGGSNPRDFWNVPFFAFTVVLFVRIFLLFILTTFGVAIFLYYRDKQRKVLITSLDAPDYATAVTIKNAGFTNYLKLLKAEQDAELLAQDATSSYYQGEYRKAIQLYEQALTVVERTKNDSLIANIIFKIACIHKELQELTTNSLILKLLPRRSGAVPVIEAATHMLHALVSEAEKNWGTANESWSVALGYTEGNLEFQLICQGAIIELDVKNWLNDPDITTRESLVGKLDEWQEACKANQYFASLCQACLLQAKIAFALVKFEKMEIWLDRCLKIAEENNLKIYLELTHKEKNIFLQHRERISSLLEGEGAIPQEEKLKLIQDYIKTALEIIESEKKSL